MCHAGGAQVIVTSNACLTGTDRIYQFAVANPSFDFIINYEPTIDPDDIMVMLDHAIQEPSILWNGIAPISAESERRSRTVPKVVVGHNNRLLYMSRSSIPGNMHDTFEKGWMQICIYSSPAEALVAFGACNEKSTPRRLKISKSFGLSNWATSSGLLRFQEQIRRSTFSTLSPLSSNTCPMLSEAKRRQTAYCVRRVRLPQLQTSVDRKFLLKGENRIAVAHRLFEQPAIGVDMLPFKNRRTVGEASGPQ